MISTVMYEKKIEEHSCFKETQTITKQQRMKTTVQNVNMTETHSSFKGRHSDHKYSFDDQN